MASPRLQGKLKVGAQNPLPGQLHSDGEAGVEPAFLPQSKPKVMGLFWSSQGFGSQSQGLRLQH